MGLLPGTLPIFDVRNAKFSTIQFFQNMFQLFFRSDIDLLIRFPIKFGNQRFLLAGNPEIRLQIPVFFGNKCVDLIFPVSDQTQGDGLDTSGT